jgi:hypothetical protein
MTKKIDFNQVWKDAFNYAKKKDRNIAEDFAQFHTMKVFEGSKKYLKFSFIDFLRQENADLRTESGKIKFQVKKNYIPIEDCYNLQSEIYFEEKKHDRSYLFKNRDVVIYQWSYQDEMSSVRIASIFGLTESRISQKLKEMENRLQRSMLWDEFKERKEWDDSLFKFKVDWISI